MTTTKSGVPVAGGWLAAAAILLALALVFHGPVSTDLGEQMERIADGSLRWSIVHWTAAAALSFFAIAGLIALSAGSRLTQHWWTQSAWAVLPIGALWTVSTAVAEATVVFDAAVAGDRVVFEAWWQFSEGMANGFAIMALAVAVIAGSEAGAQHRATPRWAAVLAAAAGVAAFAGWVLGIWFSLAFGAPMWVVASLLTCLWLAWFGLSLLRADAAGYVAQRQDAPFRA